MGADGILRYRGEADEFDASSPRTSPLTGLPLSMRREVSENAVSKRIKRHEPYSRHPHALLSNRQHRTSVTAPLPKSTDGSQPQRSQSQQDVTTTPIASPTSPQEAQAPPQESTDPSPPATASPPTPTGTTPTAPYPPPGVAPYYGYVQPPPSHVAIYTPHPGYPSGQSQYVYPGYPPPASIPQTSSAARDSSPSRSPAAVPPDSSQAQTSTTATSSCRTRSPGVPRTQTQSQVGYYPLHVHQPPLHVHQPHLYYP